MLSRFRLNVVQGVTVHSRTPTAGGSEWPPRTGLLRTPGRRSDRERERDSPGLPPPGTEVSPGRESGDKSAEARFKEIGEAYEVLSDPEKRKKYDQFGPNWQQFERGGPPPGAGRGDYRWASGQDGVGFEGFGDIDESTLNDLLGGLSGGAGAAGAGVGGRRQRRTSAHPGQDYEQPVDITLEEAFAGTQRVLQLQAPDSDTRRLEVECPPASPMAHAAGWLVRAGRGWAARPTATCISWCRCAPSQRSREKATTSMST